MKKLAKIAFCLALVGAIGAMIMAPTPAQAAWTDKTVTVTGAGYYSGTAGGTDNSKVIYVAFTYSSSTYTRFSRADVSDINQQLATALTALSNGGAAVLHFDEAQGASVGLFTKIRAGN